MGLAGSVVRSVAIVGLGMLLGACAYESIVMAPNYAAQVPQSLEHARRFMVASNPGHFFRVLSPVTQVTLVLAVILTWRVRGARWWIVGALAAAVVTDVITFTFHYPRNAILFQKPLTDVPVASLQQAAREWGPGNNVRVALLACAVVSALIGHSRSVIRPVDQGTRPSGAPSP